MHKEKYLFANIIGLMSIYGVAFLIKDLVELKILFAQHLLGGFFVVFVLFSAINCLLHSPVINDLSNTLTQAGGAILAMNYVPMLVQYFGN